MKKYKNIYLIGLMGSGKTTLGKILSKKLDKHFYDSDQVIEEKLGVNVPMIFEYEGEAGFREREKDILKELVSKQNIVLATGGGIILSESNRDLLAKNGIVIYLKTNQKEKHLNKQSFHEPNHRNFLPTDPHLERLRKITMKLVEEKMLNDLKADAIEAKYNQDGQIKIELSKIP